MDKKNSRNPLDWFTNWKIGAKILTGYMVAFTLAVIIGVLAIYQFGRVSTTIYRLTGSLAQERNLAEKTALQIHTLHECANQYINQGQNPADLETYNQALGEAQVLLNEADQINAQTGRTGRQGQVRSDFNRFAAAFAEIVQLLAARQSTVNDVLTPQGALSVEKLAVLRNNSYETLAFATAHYASQARDTFSQMQVNVIQYLATGNEQYASQVDANYATIRSTFDLLRASARDDASRLLLGEIETAAAAYDQSFQNARAGIARQHELTAQLDALGSEIITKTTAIADDINIDFTSQSQDINIRVRQLQIWTVLMIFLAIIVGMIFDLALSRAITRPIEQMARAAQGIARGAFDQQVEIPGKDELGILAEAFNDMTTRVRETLAALQEDIVKRRRTEEALEKSVAQMSTLINTLPDLVWLKDPDGVYLECNSRFEQLINTKEKDVIGKTDYDFFDRELADFFRENDVKAIAVGKPTRNEEEVIFANDGHHEILETIKTPVLNAHREVIGVLGIGRDITERKQAEEALKKSEARYRFISENTADVIWTLSLKTGKFTYVSASVQKLRGYTPEEVLNQTMAEALTPESLQTTMRLLQQRLAERSPGDTSLYKFVNEVDQPRKDGSVVPTEVATTIVFDEQGQPVEVIGVTRDITERKRAEEALRASHQLLERALASLRDAVFIIDAQTVVITDCNPAATEIFGYSREEMLGRTTAFLHVDPAALEEFRKHLLAAMTEKGFLFLPGFKMKRKGGIAFPTEHTVMPLKDEQGRQIGWVSVVRDITERKQAEEERERLAAQVRAQARQMEQILATVPAGVLLLGAAGRIMRANPAAEKALVVLTDAKGEDGLSRLGDRPLAELLTSPPTQGLWHEVKAEGRTFEIIARPVEVGPEPEHWVLAINDVTREREVQVQLQQQERLAAVGQLAAGIAHDFNNLMAVMALYTQMVLKTPELSAKSHERLEIVAGQVRRATALIQQILDFSRRAVLERRPLALASFLKEVVKLLERTIPESIQIKLTYEMDEYTVNADPTRLQQMVMNVVVNARDAMPEGGKLDITLSRSVVTDTGRCVICGQEIEGEWVQIRVADTGAGIPPEILPHIFEPFFTTKEAGKGTGLGLAQVYGIVAQHDGHLEVTTQIGKGTTFTVYLPALLAQSPETPLLTARTAIHGHGETLLVVEDDVNLREALGDSLEQLNYRVLRAANGRAALEILAQHIGDIALVLSDMVMPEMGGQALFQALRQHGLTLPVLMLSGHPMENELESLKAQGLAGWLPKPPDIAELSHLIGRALRAAAERDLEGM